MSFYFRACGLFLRVFFILAIGISGMNANGKPMQPKSVALAKLMKVDSAAVIGARAHIVASVPTDAERSKFLKCTDAAHLNSISDAIGAIISSVLTEEEIDAAIRFYGSHIGRKIAERDLKLLVSETSRTPYSPIIFTSEEQVVIVQFMKTSAGVKLIVDRVLDSEKFYAAVMPLTQKIVATCALVSRE